jgi:hypothetical protein
VKKGDVHGRLTLLRKEDDKWVCRCTCGGIAKVHSSNFKRTRSCGCLRRETSRTIGSSTKTHGDRKTAEYRSWRCMLDRCYYEGDKSFHRYGGRGITVCKRWQDYSTFLADIGRKPTPAHTLDRINPNGDYEPSNVRWASPIEQQSNRRDNVTITLNGRTQTVSAWARELKIGRTTIDSRLKRGLSPQEILSHEGLRHR